MNQVKIGKFISELRKEKDLTQKDLAEKLNVTDRAISKWENGRGLPDVSLLRKLSEELDVSINELLSGERLEENNKDKKVEENFYEAVNSKVKLQSDVEGYLIFKIIGYICLGFGLGFFGIEALWVDILVIVGSIFVLISSYKLVRSWKLPIKIVFCLIVCIFLFVLINYFDYINVNDHSISKPHFYYSKVTKGNCILYRNPTFKCIKNINFSTNGIDTGVCEESYNSTTKKYFVFGDEFDSLEDALNSKYCEVNYDPYNNGF